MQQERYKLNLTHKTHTALWAIKPAVKLDYLIHKVLDIPLYIPIDRRTVHRELTGIEQHDNA
ncbi:MAG: hypothetical protein ACRC2O_03135, partial [Chitinophagaceae bacterium]